MPRTSTPLAAATAAPPPPPGRQPSATDRGSEGGDPKPALGRPGERRLVLGVAAVEILVVAGVALSLAIIPGGEHDRLLIADAGLLAAGLLAAVACAAAARANRGRARAGWASLGIFGLLWSLRAAAWLCADAMGSVPRQFPAPVDLGFLAGGPAALVGVLLLSSLSPPRRPSLRGALDVAVVAASTVFISWALVFERLVEEGPLRGLSLVASAAYMVEDVGIASAVILVWLHSTRTARTTVVLLGAGLLLNAVGNVLYATGGIADAGSAGSWSVAVWISAFVLVAAAATVHRPPDAHPAPAASRLSRWRLGAAFFPLIAALGVWTLRGLWDGGIDVSLFLIGIAVIALVLWRQLLTLFDHLDITESLEQRVVERNLDLERFRTTVDDIEEAIYLVDPDGPGGLGRFVDTNAAACRMLGFSRAELLDMGPADVEVGVAVQTSESWQALFARIRQTEGPLVIQGRHRRKDGTSFPVEVSARFQEFGGRPYSVTVVRDVTERRRAEERLRRSEESFRLLFQDNPQPMLVCDLETMEFLRVNEAAVAKYGYTHEEFARMRVLDLRVDVEPAALDAYVEMARTSEGPIRNESRHRCKDGRIIEVEIQAHHQEFMGRRAMLALATDVTERRRLERELRHRAFHSQLTGLPNRALLVDRITHALARRPRAGRRIALLSIDLDGFKAVNDTLGHAAGDQVLIGVARRLADSVRSGDTPAHVGGDEFAVLVDDAEEEDVRAITRRIVGVLHRSFAVDGREVFVTGSIGVAFGLPRDRAETLMRNADAAMYVAKAQGKDRAEVFEPAMHERATRRLGLTADLRRAVERSEFVLEYQPVLCLGTGEVSGVEALVRWQHPTLGRVPPVEFIDLAESTGFIVDIGRWVLHEAARQVRRLNRSRPDASPLYVAVNVSSRQLREASFVGTVTQALESSGLDTGLLVLEVTESVLVEDVSVARERLERLRSTGVRVAMDDFGAGYSSLAYLRGLPLDIVKLDRMFVADLETDNQDRRLTLAIVRLLSTLDVHVVAEGIETEAQNQYLKALGVESGQGYLFSRPLGVDALRRFLEERWPRKGPLAARPAPPGTDERPVDGKGPAAEAGRDPGAIRLIIADDNDDLRIMLRTTLEHVGGFSVVAEAIDGRRAVELCSAERPDVVLLDIAMPGMDGLSALPLIRAASPRTRVVVLSAIDHRRARTDSEHLGADAFVAKGTRLNELVEIIRVVAGSARETAALGSREPGRGRYGA